jgi:uncharacterized protein (TIGR02271 family)
MSMPQRTTVVGVFNTRDRAEDAVRELRDAGFRDDQIGFAVKDGGAPVGTTTVAESTGDAAGGAATGAVVGGLLGAAAALLIPGIGPVLALGTLGGTVLAGAAAGAGLGALAGALIGMGVPEEEARYYEGEFNQGRVLVTVRADDRAPDAERILREWGAYDVNNRTPRMVETGTPRAAMADTGTSRERTPVGENADAIRLREEQLKVNKERVQTGEVEIGKRVVEEQRSMNVPVAREEVVVERRPVNQPAPGAVIGDDARTIEVPVTAERVDVQKQTVVTEEIGVQKRVQQANVPVNETVRREEAVINTEGDVRVHGDAGTGRAATSRWEDVMPTFRSDWQRNYGMTGRWEDYEPGYRYGWEQYNSGRWSGKSWNEVEPELRRDWSTRYPDKSWDVASNPIKHAWDHLTGTPHTHAG